MENIISEVRLWPVKNSKKAVASGYFVMGGKVKVKCAVIRSQKDDGLFVVLPYHSDENNQRFNDVEGVNKEATMELKNYILKQYTASKEEGNQFDQTATADEEEKPWG